MRYVLILCGMLLLNPLYAGSAELDPQISKLEFQGVHFGDFPAIDMICIKGLCPVGEEGVGINTNSFIPPTYNQRTSITHYYGVKISTPAFSYINDKMFQIRFFIQCEKQGQQECLSAIKNGLDSEYGLSKREDMSSKKLAHIVTTESFITESGSSVLIVLDNLHPEKNLPLVKIFDRTLMDIVRKSLNPDYVPRQELPRATPLSR